MDPKYTPDADQEPEGEGAPDLKLEAQSYIPNLPKEELELQILAAMIECSDRRFLPARLGRLSRAEVIERFRELQKRERMNG